MTDRFKIDEVTMRMMVDVAPQGGPGITHEVRDSGEGNGEVVDWLVHRTEDGEVTAVLIHRADGPSKGNVLGFVLPEYQRQGIATEVWGYAAKHLGVKPEEQFPSEDSEQFFKALEDSA